MMQLLFMRNCVLGMARYIDLVLTQLHLLADGFRVEVEGVELKPINSFLIATNKNLIIALFPGNC